MDMPKKPISKYNESYYNNTEIYSITISPPPRPQDIDILFEEDSKYIRRELNKLCQHYCLYPEFDIYGRLHYHGILAVYNKSKLPRLQYNVKVNLGFTKINTIKDYFNHLKWLIYCQKEYNKTRLYFVNLIDPIIYKKIKTNTFTKIKNKIKNNVLNYFL